MFYNFLKTIGIHKFQNFIKHVRAQDNLNAHFPAYRVIYHVVARVRTSEIHYISNTDNNALILFVPTFVSDEC